MGKEQLVMIDKGKLKICLCEVLFGIIVFLMGLFFVLIYVTPCFKCEVYFGESHLQGETRIYFTAPNCNMSEDMFIAQNIDEDFVELELSSSYEHDREYRLDPINVQEDFSIKEIKLSWIKGVQIQLTGKDLADYISSYINCEGAIQDEYLNIKVTTDDPILELSESFSDIVEKNTLKSQYAIALRLLFVYIVIRLGIKYVIKSPKCNSHIYYLIVILINVVVCLGFVMNYALKYLVEHFDNVPWGQLLYHLHTPLNGTNMSSFNSLISTLLLIIFIITAIIVGISLMLRNMVYGVRSFLSWCIILGVILSGYAVYQLDEHFNLKQYYEYVSLETNIYDEYYVDGRDIEIIFPEEKRNLIYIFLESMETTYTDQSVGGAFDVNVIPELTELAMNNIDFSNDGMNGGYVLPGTEFTMGGLVAQTSGVPINETLVSNDTLNATWESENNYLPGAWAIGDVLEENGYNQEFMIGSDGKFAGRSSYFRGHGDYEIVDYVSAMEEGRIPDGYRVWWGYEDEKLFAFAKEDILKLASDNKPFNFTMLTVDTHFTDGYLCPLCEDKYESQYSNVLACSSKQVAEFVDWVKQQDFYTNTTIVIVGDHMTMDSAYIEKNGAGAYDRKVYCTIINSSEECAEPDKTKIFSTLDLYPTTLAGLGVSIEGNRLGLGVNLFSDEPTLIEQFGKEYVATELIKNSNYYTHNLLYGKK